MKKSKKILLKWASTYGEDENDVRASMYGEDMMIEFAKYYHKQKLTLTEVGNSLLEIELKSWEHTCGDGCCYTDGMDIFLNNEQLDEQNAEDSVNALTAVLDKLGYKFEINCA